MANPVVIIPIGLGLLLADQITVVTLLFFLIVGVGYSAPLVRFYDLAFRFSAMTYAGAVVATVMDEATLPDTGRRVPLDGHDVEFRQVSFGYGDTPVLDGLSLLARAGEITALVGPSGAGKTTIARLIPRFWDVGSGAVLVGGVDVRDMAVDQLMEQVAFVFQDTFLFHDTVAANIRLGRPDAGDDEVLAAARAAQAEEFISALPSGFQTVLGAKGVALSGGERQRIAIARAILKDAPIVVLDEATAFTDPENEAAVQKAIGALTAGRTLIVVAHRLATVGGAARSWWWTAAGSSSAARPRSSWPGPGYTSGCGRRRWRPPISRSARPCVASRERPDEPAAGPR
ncbi:MAG: ABC transporter ATP-binding protein [Pseudonocardiaceae bacterium]